MRWASCVTHCVTIVVCRPRLVLSVGKWKPTSPIWSYVKTFDLFYQYNFAKVPIGTMQGKLVSLHLFNCWRSSIFTSNMVQYQQKQEQIVEIQTFWKRKQKYFAIVSPAGITCRLINIREWCFYQMQFSRWSWDNCTEWTPNDLYIFTCITKTNKRKWERNYRFKKKNLNMEKQFNENLYMSKGIKAQNIL